MGYEDEFPKSLELFKRAEQVMPGGVSSPVRRFDPYPFYVERAEGSRLYTVDGHILIDYCLAFGPLILGHSHPEVVEAVIERVREGFHYGTPALPELELAEKVVELVPNVEKVRLVNTGTEATMSAIRLARAYTGREKVVKFEGCYHGAHDAALVRAGSGASELGAPDSPGIPESVAENTLVCPFNDVEAFVETVEKFDEEIGAVIVEPVLGNAGCVPPDEEFLKVLREYCDGTERLLIFDEVITGFRLGLGGAQEYYGIDADLVCLGKILGGGLPIGAFGGPEEYMSRVAPEGKVYQAGTFNGNPVSATAGLVTLEILERERPYGELSSKAKRLASALEDGLEDRGIEGVVNRVESMFQVYFGIEEVRDYAGVNSADHDAFKRFHMELLERGVWIAASNYEAWFLSIAHTEEDLERTEEAVGESLDRLTG
ncbi:glutamate-1-semialdehyde 2,1-aminomutase [Methanopyrus sp.]